jgi:hypothetical protein
VCVCVCVCLCVCARIWCQKLQVITRARSSILFCQSSRVSQLLLTNVFEVIHLHAAQVFLVKRHYCLLVRVHVDECCNKWSEGGNKQGRGSWMVSIKHRKQAAVSPLWENSVFQSCVSSCTRNKEAKPWSPGNTSLPRACWLITIVRGWPTRWVSSPKNVSVGERYGSMASYC